MSVLDFNCRHAYGPKFDLGVAFQAGEGVTCLFGPSGCGKTTILNIIAGVMRPQSGTVTLRGRPLTDTKRGVHLPPEHRHVGMVFQDHLLFPHMNVAANLSYGRRRAGNSAPIELERVAAVLELEPLMHHLPKQLSGGERQRVALGRALLSHPDLLLMDEPLVSLDDALKLRVLSYLESVVHEWTIPTIFVTHAQTEVRRLAEWVVVLDAGRVITQGRPDDALSQPAALGLKNTAAPVNLLRIDQVHKHDGQWFAALGDQRLRLPSAPQGGDAFFVQFSPTDVTLACHDVTGLSARNHLQGTIRQLVDVSDSVFVAIDVGQIIWAEVTAEAVHELDLAVGTPVTGFIKTRSLQVLSDI